ncbi:MAG: hypothetical protein ACSLFR_15105 [Solirubrobacteraceae bacterium]
MAVDVQGQGQQVVASEALEVGDRLAAGPQGGLERVDALWRVDPGDQRPGAWRQRRGNGQVGHFQRRVSDHGREPLDRAGVAFDGGFASLDHRDEALAGQYGWHAGRGAGLRCLGGCAGEGDGGGVQAGRDCSECVLKQTGADIDGAGEREQFQRAGQ